MPLQDELGARMKEFYEEIPKTKLMRRTPVASEWMGSHSIHSHVECRGLLMRF